MEVVLYFLIVALIFLMTFTIKGKEKFKPMTDLNLDQNKILNFDFPVIPKVIELEKLSNCSPKINYFYGYNQHYIWNDGSSVTIEILRQISRNYLIYNEDTRFHLRAIRFEKSNILDNGKAYLLQLTLVHSGTMGMCNFSIIVPLKFTENPEITIVKKSDVPQYKCCSKEFGKVVKEELGKLSSLLNQTTYKKYNINKRQHLLITRPINISVDLGLDILEKLKSKNESLIEDESSWLNQDFMEV